FHPAADILRGWINDKEVYFTTSREFQYSLGSRLYKTDLNGGLATPLSMPEAYQGSPSADGRYWAYIKNGDPTERDRVAFKRYRGGALASICSLATKTLECDVMLDYNCSSVRNDWLGIKVYLPSVSAIEGNIFS